jgi:hypothetical protein
MITELDLRNINKIVAQNLIALHNEKDGIKNNTDIGLRLIFPQYERKTGTEIRISEQESRVLYCNELEKYYKEIFYSVETPTVENYHFGKELKDIKLDKTGQSALSDMSLFELENGRLKQKVDIEFKAHNVELSHIAKDILKLFAEEQSGLFFHTLKAVNSGTLNNDGNTGVLDKYRESVDEFKCKWKPTEDGNEKYIIFAICIIEQKVLLMKTFKKSDLGKTKEFFKIDYKLIKEMKNTNINEWIKEDLI